MNNWGNINIWYHSFITEWTTKDSIQNFIYVFRSWCKNYKALTLEQAKCKQVFPSLSVNERSAFCSNNNSVKERNALNTSSIKRRKSSTPLDFKKKYSSSFKLNTAHENALSAIFLLHCRYPYNPYINCKPL